MVGGFCGVMMFLFMHETFWDRREVRGEGEVGDAIQAESDKGKPEAVEKEQESQPGASKLTLTAPEPATAPTDPENAPAPLAYTPHRLAIPALPFTAYLRPFHGRLLPPSRAHWHHVATRPLLLFLYPSILYSASLYAF